MLEFKKVKQHKKYLNDYFFVNNEIYLKEELASFFLVDAKKLDEMEVSETQKTIKPYRYKNKRYMDKQIIEQRKKLFESLNLGKAKTSYENIKIAESILKHFVQNIHYNAMTQEDRIFALKNKKFELKQNQKHLEKAYEKQIFNEEKAYKKAKSLLREIEKQTALQNAKMLYDVLVKKQASNISDCFTLMYLLNKLNIDAFVGTIKNKEQNTYSVVLIPSKKNSYDSVKYYIVDVTKNRRELKQETLEDKKVTLFGKQTLLKEYEQYEFIRFENTEKVILPNTKEWNKTVKQITNDVITLNI